MRKVTKKPPLKVKAVKGKIEAKTGKGLVPVSIKNHKDNKGGHPHIIVEDLDDKHVSVGLSTKLKKGKGSTNYTMDTSPFGDGKKSYMKRQGTVDPKEMYFNPRQGKITPKDYTRAKEYGDKAKRKYIEKKGKKK